METKNEQQNGEQVILTRKPRKDLGESEEDFDEEERLIAPDGGWGWIIVISGFFAHVLSDGVMYAFGVILDELLTVYENVSMFEITFVGSILPAVIMGVGPLASALIAVFGARPITIAGAIIAGVSLIVSAFAPNLIFLSISVGVFSGCGFGIVYLPAIIMVSNYFEKRRSLAMGLTVVGSGVGTVAFPPLLRFLVAEYGWRGTLFILGALVFNCIACGLVLLPLRKTKVYVKKRNLNKQPGEKKVVAEVTRDLEANMHLLDEQKGLKKAIIRSSDRRGLTRRRWRRVYHIKQITLTRPNKLQSTPEKPTICTQILNSLNNSFDFTLFKDIPFSLFCISSFTTTIGYNAPYLFVVMWGNKELGYSETSAALLTSFIGIGNIAGRLVLGFIGDYQKIPRFILYSVALSLCGCFTVACPFYSAYWWMVIAVVAFGFFIAAYVSLTPLILVDMLGLERLDFAFGMLGLVQCFATLIGPPALAKMRDISGSFALLFYACGGVIALSGLMLLPVYFCFKRLQPISKQQTKATSAINQIQDDITH